MKLILSFAASTLAAITILSVMPVFGEAEIYNDVLRLHVIAESDSKEDQEIKLKVRDAVIECLSEKMGECESLEEAWQIADSLKEEIVYSANNCIIKNGSDATVRVELGKERYPRKEYGDATLPSGVYNSLRVIIGEGNGQNWWCILFPSICTNFAISDKSEEEYLEVGFTPREYRMITGENGQVKIRFKILEVLSNMIGFDY